MNAADPQARIVGHPVGPFQSNTWIVSVGERALVIDPGDEAARTRAVVESSGLRVEGIVLTHAHLDHVGGVAELEAAWDVDSWLHPLDFFLLDRLAESCAMYGLPAMSRPARVRPLEAPSQLSLGSLELEVRFAPGHSPGHIIVVGQGFAVVGDVIFAGSVGRTDLPGGDAPTLMRSIEEQVLSLPDDTVLYSGHGPATTVGEERRSNPFLQPGGLGQG